MLDNALKILAGLLAVTGGFLALRAQRKRAMQETPPQSHETTKAAPRNSIFETLLNIVGVLGSVLAFPLFVYLFMILVSLMIHLWDSPIKETEAFSQKYGQLPTSEQSLYAAISAAQVDDSSTSRDELLKEVANRAIADHYYTIALDAIQKTSSSSLHDQLLIQLLDQMDTSENVDLSLKILESISSTSTKSQRIKAFADAILRGESRAHIPK